jgi:allantoate deiminase
MGMESALAAVSADRIADRIAALAAIGRDPAGGITRLGLTVEEQAARDLVRSWLAPLGYQCRQDDAGNLHCRAGDGPRVLVGSHLDTVPRGGAYDGALGVIAAAEVAEALHQAGIALPLHVVAWTGEEGVRFGTGLFGSAAACGVLPPGAWERPDAGGTSALQAAAELLGRPVRPQDAALDRDAVRAYLELHIEQASELERRGCPLGVVTSIVGLYHGRVRIVGRADHAGATAMDERKDALAAAAECVLAVEEVSRAAAGEAIATVGEIEVSPGAQKRMSRVPWNFGSGPGGLYATSSFPTSICG